MPQFQADPRFEVILATTEGETILAMNHTRAPFDDLRFRQALAHAIDRKALVEGAMFGMAIPNATFFPPHHPAWVDLSDLYPYDPERARALLAQTNYDGRQLSMRLPPFAYAQRSGEMIQSQLAAVGLNVAIENLEWNLWLEDVFRNKNYDFTIVAHVESNDLGNFARGSSYYWGYDDPEFAALWEQIRVELNEERRNDLLRQAQRHVSERAVLGFLFQMVAIGIYRQGVHGFWDSQPFLSLPLHEVRVG